MPPHPAGRRLSPVRRYQLRQVSAMLAYALTLPFAIRAFRDARPSGFAEYALAISPALPILGIVVAIGLYLMEEDDEFRRMKTVMVLLGGLGVVLSVTTVWGFLEAFAGLPHVPLFWVFPIFCVGLLASAPIVAWRYR